MRKSFFLGGRGCKKRSKPAMFMNTVEVTPRDNNRHRYKKVALIVDGVEKSLTPDKHDWLSGPFNMLSPYAGSTLEGREFKLDWTKDGDDQFAQVKFIEIDYAGKFPFLGSLKSFLKQTYSYIRESLRSVIVSHSIGKGSVCLPLFSMMNEY